MDSNQIDSDYAFEPIRETMLLDTHILHQIGPGVYTDEGVVILDPSIISCVVVMPE